jgi:hypothetical protein
MFIRVVPDHLAGRHVEDGAYAAVYEENTFGCGLKSIDRMQERAATNGMLVDSVPTSRCPCLSRNIVVNTAPCRSRCLRKNHRPISCSGPAHLEQTARHEPHRVQLVELPLDANQPLLHNLLQRGRARVSRHIRGDHLQRLV